MQGYRRFLFLISLVAILFQGCNKTDLYSGTGVSFNASSKGADTKVSYDGTQNNLRAIKWTQGDLISIYCAEAYDVKIGEYKVGPDINSDGSSSIAKGVAAVSESNILKWNGDKDHHFYCVYPAVDNGVTKSVSNAGWTGSVPATQQYGDGSYSELSPYMMLVGYTKSKPQPKVDVDFYPITTCLEFEMMNGGEYDLTVNEISLTSFNGEEALSGDFSVLYNSNNSGYDAFVTSRGISTGESVTVEFGEAGFDFEKKVNDDGPKLCFKMFLNPANDIKSPYLTIKAVRSDGVPIILRTQLKKKSEDVTFTKKHITPLTGILVEGGFILTSFGNPELTEWEDVEDNLTVSDEYEYSLEVVGSNALTFEDSGDGLAKTLQVKSYRQAKDGKMTAVKPSLDFSESPFVDTNPTITLFDSAECIYSIEFEAQPNSPVVTTVDVSSALKNATPVSNHDLSSGDTANCYVVKAPGTYKFKIAYGNGVGYGTGGSKQYTGTPGGNDPKVLWSTYDDLITSVAYSSDGYITFTVDKDNIQQGNALIALKNGSTITWSWHIWFTDADVSTVPLGYYSTGTRTVTTYSKRECTVVVSNPYDPFKSSNATITMSQGVDKEEATEKISSGCTYYQWGRKDPFLVNKYTKSTPSDGYTFSQAVQNPTVWVKATGRENDWTHDGNTHYGDLWGSTKTVFDPCPPGYHVPGSYASSIELKKCGYINDSGSNVENQAKYWTYSSDKTGMSSSPAATAKDNGNSSVLKCSALCVMPVK